jgi:beta-lactamase regulating signal transducer with metallopeptidase domain
VDLFVAIGLSNAVAALVLALLAFGVSRVCRRPAVVHGLWLLVLIKLVTPPIFWIPVVTLPAQEAVEAASAPAAAQEAKSPVAFNTPDDVPGDGDAAWEADAAQPALVDEPAATDITTKPDATPASSTLPSAEAENVWQLWFVDNWRLWLVGIWGAGALGWLVLAAIRVISFHRLMRYAIPASEELQARADGVASCLGLKRAPEVRLIPGPVSPMLWFLTTRPRLLLPAELAQRLSERQLAPLLAHELAHYRRGDHWIRWLELAATCLYWWHPVLWFAKRELREAEEQCCDAWVVWALPDAARSYALALVETVDFLAEIRPALPALASGLGQVTQLQRRVTMIMKGNTPRALSWAGTLGLLGLAVALVPWVPTWAQDRPRPPGGGDESRDREPPDREKQARIEQTRATIQQLAEQMRRLSEQMQHAQRQLAELEGRPMEARGGGRIGNEAGRRPGADAERTARRDDPAPAGGAGGRGPGGGGPPGFGGSFPGQPGAPAGGGPGGMPPGGFGRGMPGMPGMTPGGMPPGMANTDVNRRLDELERKMERIMQLMERMDGRRSPDEAPQPPRRGRRGDGDGERRERGEGGELGERGERVAEPPSRLPPAVPAAPAAPRGEPEVPRPPATGGSADELPPSTTPTPERR